MYTIYVYICVSLFRGIISDTQFAVALAHAFSTKDGYHANLRKYKRHYRLEGPGTRLG